MAKHKPTEINVNLRVPIWLRTALSAEAGKRYQSTHGLVLTLLDEWARAKGYTPPEESPDPWAGILES